MQERHAMPGLRARELVRIRRPQPAAAPRSQLHSVCHTQRRVQHSTAEKGQLKCVGFAQSKQKFSDLLALRWLRICPRSPLESCNLHLIRRVPPICPLRFSRPNPNPSPYLSIRVCVSVPSPASSESTDNIKSEFAFGKRDEQSAELAGKNGKPPTLNRKSAPRFDHARSASFQLTDGLSGSNPNGNRPVPRSLLVPRSRIGQPAFDL